MTQLINLEAEQAIIGALLNDSESFDRIANLSNTDFSNATHDCVFKAIQALCGTGKQCDVISVFEKTKNQGVTIDYLNQLSISSVSSSRIATHSKIVRDVSMRRKIAQIGVNFSEIAESALCFEEALEQASTAFNEIANQSEEVETTSLSDLMLGIFDTMQERLTGKKKRLSTGFSKLDRMTSGGFDRGELILVAGRPAMGKTGFALSIAKNMSKDYSCLFFSMEMPKEQIRDRFTSMLGRVPLSFVIDPVEEDTQTNRQDWASIVEATSKAKDHSFYIDDRSQRSLLDIRIKAKEVKRKHGLDIVFVDYLGLMGGGDKNENRTQQIGSYSRGLKALAKDLNIAVVCLAQLNRGLEQRPDKRPLLSDLRDSGEIEQDADMVFMLYRDEVYHPDTTCDRGIAEIIIRKQRQGVTGTVPMAFIGEQTRFETLESRWTPPSSFANKKPVSRGFD